MRFVWAVLAFVLAAVSFGAGIAQRTVFLGPDSAEQRVTASEELPYTVIDADAFALLPGTQTLRIAGEGEVFTAFGRTADVAAWLSDQSYNRIVVDADGELTAEAVDPATEPGEGTEGRNPAGSDLWVEEQVADGQVERQGQLPEGMSMLIAADGTAPAPGDISLTWPLDQRTPWFGPLMVLGGVLLALGILLYALAIRHTRRRRGPLRKGSAIAAADETRVDAELDEDRGAAEKGVASATRSRRRGGGRRRMAAVGALGVSTVLLAGCSPDSWPDLTPPTASPSPSPSADPAEGERPPALTKAQADRIVSEISATVAEADEARDAGIADDRLAGAALTAREVNYELRGAVEDYAAPAPIPATTSGGIVLPQAVEGWPRTALVVLEDEGDATVPPTILSMTQDDPWSDYRVSYLAAMQGGAQIPQLAPDWLGAALVPPDSSFLLLAPDELAAAYADVIGAGEDSEFAALFDTETDGFLAAVSEKRQATLDEFNETGEETGTMEFAQEASDTEPVALATLDSGAIVAVGIEEAETATPNNEDAEIRLTDPAVSFLAGEEETATGVRTTYRDQLFFFVPAQGSTEQIRLLGYVSSLHGAEILPEGEDAPEDETPDEETPSDEEPPAEEETPAQ